MNRALLLIMKSDAAKYADFVIRMLACEASEIADIAKFNAKFSAPKASQSLETVRPSK